ncbi:MAG: hypothetical protein PWQ12_1313 [Clostridiales bacterium]|nr:hypothetical protein [Clostridiales bacterium]
MRKLLSVMLVLVMASSLFIGCSSNTETTAAATTAAPETTTSAATEATTVTDGAYADGVYFASQPTFGDTGWKYVVTLVVEGGKIVSADWNGGNVAGGKDKKTLSADGEYGMDWHLQAKAVEDYLIENQSLENLNYTDEEGHTDSVAGVSIHVKEFDELVTEALAQGPVGYGKYVDGAFYAEQAEYGDSGWKDTFSATVISGYIVSASWNGISESTDKDKKTASMDGDYPMVANGGASSEWYEQAAMMEDFLIQTQSVDAITMDASTHTDTVAGVTISVASFVELATEALQLR